MEAKLQKMGDVNVISVSGKISIEEKYPLRRTLKSLQEEKVVFCLDKLSFVGSTGIQSFFEIMSEVNQGQKYGFKITGLTKDFQRVLEYTKISNLEVFEQINYAVESFTVESNKSIKLAADFPVEESEKVEADSSEFV